MKHTLKRSDISYQMLLRGKPPHNMTVGMWACISTNQYIPEVYHCPDNLFWTVVFNYFNIEWDKEDA